MNVPHTEIRACVEAWLAAHPGEHSMSDIVTGTGLTVVEVGRVLTSMRRRGTIRARREGWAFFYRHPSHGVQS